MPQQRAFGKKHIKAVYATYGERDLYNSGNFDPKTRNLTTGATHGSHHCSRCKKARTKACFEDLHHGFCAEYVTRNGRRERCGECFAFESDGCGTHRKVHGCNAAFYRAFDGQEVQLGDFDDPEQKKVGPVPVGDSHDKAAELAAVEEAADAYVAKHGYLPATFQNDYFQQRARELTYAQAEQSLVFPGGLTENQDPTKIKTAGGKRNKRGSRIVVDTRRRDAHTQLNPNLDGSAVKPKGKDQHAAKKSLTMKGANPKKPMGAPRRSEDQDDEVSKGPKDRARTFAEKVLGKLGGVPE